VWLSIINGLEEQVLASIKGIRGSFRKSSPADNFQSKEDIFDLKLSVAKVQIDNFSPSAEFDVVYVAGPHICSWVNSWNINPPF
jgi:hypothetical protein